MKPAAPLSVKFTYDDVLNFPADGKRREIIDGERYVAPSPNTKHQIVSLNLASALHAYLAQHPFGVALTAPFDVVLSDLDVVEPDVLYVSQERATALTEARMCGAPDLVVEIVSPGTRKTDEITNESCTNDTGLQSPGSSTRSWRQSRSTAASPTRSSGLLI